MESVKYGSLPFSQQIQFFLSKVQVPTASWTDIWHKAHDTAFVVAGAMKADLLNDLHTAVQEAITSGTTLREFRKNFDLITAHYGWSYKGSRNWRSRVIYDTNLRASYQAGRYAQLIAVKDSRPFWRYRHNDSVRFPRPMHQAWNGLVLSAEDRWWQTHYPPNGWGCKCYVEALGPRDLRRLGLDGPMQAPPVKYRKVTVGTRGPSPRTVRVPVGIDPGWGYAPGQSVVQRLLAATNTKATKMPPALGAALKAKIKKIPPPPPPPPPQSSGGLWGDKIEGVFSTGKITAESLSKTLADVPGAADRVAQLGEFLRAGKVQGVFVTAQQMNARTNAAKAIAEAVNKFLGYDDSSLRRFSGGRDWNGFTSMVWRHVVVKAPADVAFKRSTAKDLEKAIAEAFAIREGGTGAYRMRDGSAAPWSFSSMAKDEAARVLITYAHEMGHQIDYFAGGQIPVKAWVTRYSQTNSKEWHAEHFAAWLLNRDALAAWNEKIARYFDRIMASAIEKATQRNGGS